MTEEEVTVLLNSIHGLWSAQLSDEQVAAWKMAMGRWDFDVMMDALGRYSEASPSFPPKPLELTALARSIVSERKALDAPASMCDGSGWIEDPILGIHPCPSCNPYLWAVFGDASKWLQYLRGARLDHLHPDVRYNERTRELVVDVMPLPCDPISEPVGPAIGGQIARQAYRAEREQMALPHNEAWVSGALRDMSGPVAQRERAIANIRLGPVGEAVKRRFEQPHDPAEPRPPLEPDDDF
jgi:hypothetical protein